MSLRPPIKYFENSSLIIITDSAVLLIRVFTIVLMNSCTGLRHLHKSCGMSAVAIYVLHSLPKIVLLLGNVLWHQNPRGFYRVTLKIPWIAWPGGWVGPCCINLCRTLEETLGQWVHSGVWCMCSSSWAGLDTRQVIHSFVSRTQKWLSCKKDKSCMCFALLILQPLVILGLFWEEGWWHNNMPCFIYPSYTDSMFDLLEINI